MRRMRVWFGAAVFGAVGLLAPGAQAQSFDCSRARSASERAICAQPALGALDKAVADAYAAALARPGTDAAALRTGQQAWLRGRDAGCAGPATSLAACLTRSMTARIAALAPPPGQAGTPAAQGGPAQPSVPQAGASSAGASSAGAPPALPPQTAQAAQPDPAIPPGSPPPAAATLDRAALPATEPGSALLRVTAAGRFSLQAHSASGTALQLVDMMAGPAAPVGEAGVSDGRTDVLLDAGAYKLRTQPAPGATGDVALQALPFQDAAPPAAIPAPGATASFTLDDLQQRAFWLLVGGDGAVRIDAAGRALADLRLWEGAGPAGLGDLVPLEPSVREASSVPGHPMRGLSLRGKVAPGTYLLVAYGGPALAWADGSQEAPFHVRFGARPDLAEGWASGTVGPLGSELFAAPARANRFRLDLPAAAAALLDVDGRNAAIAPNSREPHAAVMTGANPALVEVVAAAGQSYALRAQETSSSTSVYGPGAFWVSAPMTGAGGEEAPPTALLVQGTGPQYGRILASTAPRVGPGVPWRTSFNVRGTTTLLLDTASGGLTVAGAEGLGLLPVPPRTAQLPDGIVAYTMSPGPGRQGVVDLVFGAPGAAVGASVPNTAPAPRWPADPVLALGVRPLELSERLDLVSNQAPGLQAGLLARRVPVALAEGPLVVSQMPGTALAIPVQVAPGGTLRVSDPAAGVLPVAFAPNADGVGTVTLPSPDRPRTVVLTRYVAPPPRAAIPAPPPRSPLAALDPARPRFLDLNDGGSGTYDLTVPEGGLYRIETTGRLHTTAAIGTAFVAKLDQAEANGAGENALLQRWLRAGRYHVRVGVTNSAGHLGVRVVPAPWQDTPALLPGGTVHAAMPAGTGLAVPLDVPEAGTYHLELVGQGRSFNARLDDSEGWPLTAPGELASLERDLPAGRLRLLVQPEATDARVLVRLRRVRPDPVYEGHGPFALVPATEAGATWREPAGRDDPRTPDRWTFTLAGPAQTTLALSGGMVADLWRDDAGQAAPARPVVRLLGPRPFRGRLEAGRYRLDAASLGRNDRLDYTISLNTAELQPGVSRAVLPDATVPFALAQPGVVSLTSFGALPVKAVLRDGAGAVLGRYGPGVDSWNLAVSRPLPAGAYRLELQPAVPPGQSPVSGAGRPRGVSDDAPDDAGGPQAQERPSQEASDAPSGEASSADAGNDSGSDDRPRVELTLALPEMRPPVPALSTAADLAGGGVHRLTAPQPAPGSLLLAAAASPTPVVLVVERQRGDAWDTIALDQGTAPIAAIPGDGDPAPWRVSVWAVDGGALPIRASVAALDPSATGLTAPGMITPAAAAGAATPLAIARIRLDAPAPVRLDGSGLLAGGWPGHALIPPEDGVAVPQGDTLWVVTRSGAPLHAAVVAASVNEALAVPVPAGGEARLAGPAATDGTTRVWLAESGLGQPGIDAGQGMGLSPDASAGPDQGASQGSALAVGAGPVRVWNAGGDDALRPRVTALDLHTLTAQRLDAPLQTVLPPRSALPLTLPDGERRTDLALSPSTGAVLDEASPGATVWAGDAATARSLPGGGTRLLLVNTGTQPAPVSVSWAPAAPTPPLRPGAASKRFFGAAGSFDMAVEAPPGARLRVAGDAQAVLLGADGRIRRGGDVLAGPGRLTVSHAAGPVAVWLDVPGTPAWPDAAPQPQAMPALVALGGPAMALSLAPGAPVLLHARSTAPVILTLGGAAPVLYPAGASLSRYLGGAAVLRVDSPHDGPLSGTLELTADPVTPMQDGLGAPVALAPGGAAVFGFQVARTGDVGVGVRADPDRAVVRLLGADGAVLGEGAAMLRRLAAGRYVLEARLPPDAPPATVRPAVVGIVSRPNGPPPDVAAGYLALVGLAPKDAAR